MNFKFGGGLTYVIFKGFTKYIYKLRNIKKNVRKEPKTTKK